MTKESLANEYLSRAKAASALAVGARTASERKYWLRMEQRHMDRYHAHKE